MPYYETGRSIKEIDDIDEDLVIFQKDKLSIESELALLAREENGGTVKTVKNGIEYFYLLEIFIAKEFIEGWIESMNKKPSDKEIAERLFAYAINDA
jgi:hypothetical protein